MQLLDRIGEILARAEQEGYRRTFSLGLRALGERVMPPWENLYWTSVERRSASLPPGLHLEVISSLEQLKESLRRALEDSIGRSAMPLLEERLRARAQLHVLLFGEQVAGTQFFVLGQQHAFQEIPLTEKDAMVLDLRIDPRFRGRGFASAFCLLSIHHFAGNSVERVWLSTSVKNERANRAFQAAGFRFIVRFRRCYGRYIYALGPVR